MIDTNVAPQYLPAGYHDGGSGPTASGGFAGLADQVTLIYPSREGAREPHRSLQVHFTPHPGRHLLATDQVPAKVIDLGGLSGYYHDGIAVQVGRKADGGALVEWQKIAHSITVSTTRGTFAVRAPGALPYAELLAVARSLPLW
jgi:hypothetical protein